MLYAVTQLSEYILGDVGRTLCDEVDTHALRTDKTDDLFNLIELGLRRVCKQHVCLVEEEHKLGLRQIADFRQCAVEFRE